MIIDTNADIWWVVYWRNVPCRKHPLVMDDYYGAKEYVLHTYVSPVKLQPPTTAQSANDQPGTDSGGRCSLEMDPFYTDYLRNSGRKYSVEIDESDEPRYSVDDYDSEAVDAAMQRGLLPHLLRR